MDALPLYRTSGQKKLNDTAISILDLVPVIEDGSAQASLEASADLARHADKWGFNRYWVAEHHNHPGIASSATSVVMGHLAGQTEQIRIGSGGVMLPNHASLVIAEQFGTLASLYPNRIDLGLGRAPGTDQITAHALRRTLHQRVEDFPLQIEELEAYFAGESRVRAIPGEGEQIPIWLLGSSDFSARLAAETGRPFSFASHFAGENTLPALNIYRRNFQPSDTLAKPYVMLGASVIAGDTDEHAQWIASSQQQMRDNLRRGMPTRLQPPIGDVSDYEGVGGSVIPEHGIQPIIVGGPDTVKRGLTDLIEKTGADELIITEQTYSQKDRLRSYDIIASMMA
ncbi:LLM class flavin-dependent oxidoreductase [Lentibacillus saliphilus]|uniref:LLM class flavin-dependent oxidoreductase n=1 Tax=Lentibacillus saliphilus TaxID=2737028 RepID=UPI001C311925|nr:LLM class flavin-dependent oxidoreductase [Lentibacillus saliphilus]